ncbi:MAG: 3-deoxy-manno-octulosonate cytidylyltransferase [Bacteroidetes bacterium]|nr:MAG: 3-deoxy-manno-octulosonate cytidylyltransferase [Bacteroidota bacterium]
MILGVIPARFASTRFPGKPLADLGGKSMVRRVYEQCLQASLLSEVLVATDDARIYEHVLSFGGKAVMTRDTHVSGTDRVCEVAGLFPAYSHYINIQGDEPFIAPGQIDLLCRTLVQGDAPVATLLRVLEDPELIANPHVVKAVTDLQGNALYFSRLPIPFIRENPDAPALRRDFPCYQHIGLYGFTAAALRQIATQPPAPLERAESLEQLRWLSHGMRIRTALSEDPTYAIDTPEDLARIREQMDSILYRRP